MPIDPYAALSAMVRAEAARSSEPHDPPAHTPRHSEPSPHAPAHTTPHTADSAAVLDGPAAPQDETTAHRP
ncbi:hypothetical protein [Streptomyces sp. NPDC054887]